MKELKNEVGNLDQKLDEKLEKLKESLNRLTSHRMLEEVL